MAASPPPSRRPRLPDAFRSLAWLRRFNVAAMGLSLAAATGTTFAAMLGKPNTFGAVALATGLPTLLCGIAWALLLRMRKTVGPSKVRWGWLASMPLAAVNGALACGLLFVTDGREHGDLLSKLFVGLFAGATFGALFWLPGLLATLAFFGGPLLWSQRLAARGLAGEERGERVIGVASMVLGALAIVGYLGQRSSAGAGSHPTLEAAGSAFLAVTPVLAIVAGALATGLAHARERRRRAFVADVERGEVKGYRIDDAPEGKVLLRVSTVGTLYRVANFEEEVLALDEQGEAREPARAIALREE